MSIRAQKIFFGGPPGGSRAGRAAQDRAKSSSGRMSCASAARGAAIYPGLVSSGLVAGSLDGGQPFIRRAGGPVLKAGFHMGG